MTGCCEKRKKWFLINNRKWWKLLVIVMPRISWFSSGISVLLDIRVLLKISRKKKNLQSFIWTASHFNSGKCFFSSLKFVLYCELIWKVIYKNSLFRFYLNIKIVLHYLILFAYNVSLINLKVSKRMYKLVQLPIFSKSTQIFNFRNIRRKVWKPPPLNT